MADQPDPDEVAEATREKAVEEEGDSLEALLEGRGAGPDQGPTFRMEGDGRPPEEPATEPWQPDELERAARALLKWGGRAGAAVAMKDAGQLLAFSVDREILEEGSEEIAGDLAPVLNDLAPKNSPRGKALEKMATYLGAATSIGMWGGAVAAQVAAEKAAAEERARRQEEGPNRPTKGGGDDEEDEGEEER